MRVNLGLESSTSFKYFSKQFKTSGLKVNPIFYSTSIELLKEMAIAGKGTALLPRHMVMESVKNRTLSVIKTLPLHRPIWAIMHKGDQPIVMSKLSSGLDNLLDGAATQSV